MSKFPRGVKAALALALILLLMGVTWYYNSRRQRILNEVNTSLDTIAQLKIDRITEWREARIAEASVMMASRFYGALTTRWIKQQPTAQEVETVLTGLRETQPLYRFHDALFVNADGKIYLRLNVKAGEMHEESRQALAVAFRTRKPAFTELYIAPSDNHAHADLVVPFFADNEPNGALLLDYDAGQFLYPIIDYWPVSSRSGETLLLRRDGDSVVFLNKLRHQKDTALKLHIPLSQDKVLAVRAVLGLRGVAQGDDYRGVKVLSVIKAVPDTSWIMIAKEDETEAFSVLRRESLLVLAMLLFLIASVSTALGVLWQRNEKTHYRALFELEAAQRKSEEENSLLASAIAQSGEVVVIMDIDEIVRYVNPVFESITGIKREEAIGQPLPQTVIRSQDENAFDEFWDTLRSGKQWKGRLINRKKDGSLYTEDAIAFPVFNSAGKIVNYVSITRDITEFMKLQREKERLQEQFLQAQKMESVGRLAGGVAHDFNNMLSVILGHAQVALDNVDVDSPLHNNLQEISKAALRSAELTRQLLAFARKQTVAPRVLNLNNTVGELLSMLQRIIGEDIDLEWLPGHHIWPVKIDPAQIDQILANLAVNARDAIDQQGRITIETENLVLDEGYCVEHPECAAGEYVLLALSDNGSGISKEVMDHIFEPFFTTKEVGKGTGLGLATVYGIVKQNRGFINIYSEPGKGTTFKIYFPRSSGPETIEKTEAKAEPIKGGSETILLVEDEPAVLQLTKIMLERQGYSVIAAITPNDAIRLAGGHTGDIHLLLVDVIMPEMTGRELSERLHSIRPNLKRLFMSGYTADVIAHQGVLEEGIIFLQKPFSARTLAAKVRQTLES